MREVRIEHIESDFTGFGLISFRRDKLEVGVIINESLD